MSIYRIGKIVLDYPPRQLMHLIRRRLLKQAGRAEFDDRYPCVFVLSTGRSGTQTLAALYELATNVFAYHEPNPELTALSKLFYEYEEKYLENAAISSVFREAFLTSRRRLLNYSLDCGRGYVETTPQNTFLAPVIIDAIPSVKFVHLVRDPRYVVRSAMRRKWYDGNPNDDTRIIPRPNSEAAQQWATYSTFQKNLWLWAETNRWILEVSSRLADRVLRIQAERLFEGDEETLSKLFAFIGASLPSPRKISRVLGKQLNAQRTGKFPESGDWTEEMLRDLWTIAGEPATALGYQLDTSETYKKGL